MNDSQRAWSDALDDLGLAFELDGDTLTWRGQIAGEQVKLGLDATGATGTLTAHATGPAPEIGRLAVLPVAALPDPRLAQPTGDADVDRQLAVIPRDPWAFARLDAETRAAMARLAPFGLVITPGEARLRPVPLDAWGGAELITATLETFADLARRLRERLVDPAAALRRIAAEDPDPAVRALQAARLADPEHRAAEAAWSLPIPEVADDDLGFARLTRLARGSRDEATRVAALLRLLELFGARGLDTAAEYPGPTLDSVVHAVLAVLSPGVDESLVARLEAHPGFGWEVRRWAFTHTRRGRDPGALRTAVNAPDPDLREVAITQLITHFPLEIAGPMLLSSPGPFRGDHLRAIAELVLAPARRAMPRPDEAAAALLIHLAARTTDDPPHYRATLLRALGATGDPRAVPTLEEAVAAPTLEVALIGLWGCGVPFDELRERSSALTDPARLDTLLEELRAARPVRGGELLRGMLDATFEARYAEHPDAWNADEHREALVSAMVELGDPGALPALRRGASPGWVSLDMIAAIGELGGFDEIALLDPLTRGFTRDRDVKQRARDAIARIQERLALGGEAGGLSIADASGGGLALHDSDREG